jgi:hypothetical protein
MSEERAVAQEVVDPDQIARGFAADAQRGLLVAPRESPEALDEPQPAPSSFTCGQCGAVVVEGHKCDAGKLAWDLFPFDAAEGAVRVLMYGARKYAPHQWRTGGGIGCTRAVAAAIRHIAAWLRGEDADPESGEHHLDHAIVELLFAKDAIVRGPHKGDTRWKGS